MSADKEKWFHLPSQSYHRRRNPHRVHHYSQHYHRNTGRCPNKWRNHQLGHHRRIDHQHTESTRKIVIDLNELMLLKPLDPKVDLLKRVRTSCPKFMGTYYIPLCKEILTCPQKFSSYPSAQLAVPSQNWTSFRHMWPPFPSSQKSSLH